ncbi:MAG: hypothetical protein LH647_23675 [Leptolyngbyaceae cyanobacterium CAN_BIN12]|nr:hypothetical protein [Leptolyngbyaceae cyanobacterium CAN_BIN12]
MPPPDKALRTTASVAALVAGRFAATKSLAARKPIPAPNMPLPAPIAA